MIQPTSLEAYDSIKPELGNIQQEVYDTIEKFPTVSNLDISRILNKPINSITPRVKELRDMNLVYYVGTKKDRITNRSVMCWNVR